MKKSIIFSVFLGSLLFLAIGGFAVESTDEGMPDEMLVSQEPSESFSAAEAQKSDPEVFEDDDFFMDEITPVPVAVVSNSRQKEPQPASSALNPQAMRRRWEELFSKEITSDSISYTVKPGDSLYVIARKNHTTVDLIKKINGLKGDTIFPKMKLKIHTAPFSIEIDKSRNTLVLYSEGLPVKKYSVSTGKNNCTPVGEFKIKDKLVDPTWFKTGAILPPESPKNALGTRWMGFDKPAYGIHGTIEPRSIGKQASEGCIRMLNKDVEELYSIVPVGTKVTIQD